MRKHGGKTKEFKRHYYMNENCEKCNNKKKLVYLVLTFSIGIFILEVGQLIFLAQDAFCQTAAHQPSFSDMLSKLLPMFILVFCIFYFLILRPQQNKIKEQKMLIQNLKVGDLVLTTGGILGKITKKEDFTVTLDVGGGVKIKFDTAYVVRKVEVKETGNNKAPVKGAEKTKGEKDIKKL